MYKKIMDMIASRVGKTIKIPTYTTKRRNTGEALPSYYIQVTNKRTGHIHTMSREKAFRYINNRPSLWSIANPIVGFKDEYELAA